MAAPCSPLVRMTRCSAAPAFRTEPGLKPERLLTLASFQPEIACLCFWGCRLAGRGRDSWAATVIERVSAIAFLRVSGEDGI